MAGCARATLDGMTIDVAYVNLGRIDQPVMTAVVIELDDDLNAGIPIRPA